MFPGEQSLLLPLLQMIVKKNSSSVFSGMNYEFLGYVGGTPPTHPKIRLLSRSIRENQKKKQAA